MKHLLPYFLLGGMTCITSVSQAQVSFRVGPQAGYTLSSASFSVADYPDYFTTSGSYRSGFAAGLVAQLDLTRHLSVQPTILYARKSPGVTIASYYRPNNYYTTNNYTFQLNYLTLPICLLYSQRPHGQGGQVLLGPYVGWLLGGKYSHSAQAGYGSALRNSPTFSGDVVAGDTYATSNADPNYYCQQFDAGLQAGLGYGLRNVQLQATFSLGLRDIGAAYAPTAQHYYDAPVIHTRSFLISAAYVFGPTL